MYLNFGTVGWRNYKHYAAYSNRDRELKKENGLLKKMYFRQKKKKVLLSPDFFNDLLLLSQL